MPEGGNMHSDTAKHKHNLLASLALAPEAIGQELGATHGMKEVRRVTNSTTAENKRVPLS
jgi:hypothetical protein